MIIKDNKNLKEVDFINEKELQTYFGKYIDSLELNVSEELNMGKP
ncbi:MAG: hypothetical protein RSB77_06490 [Bacilli bacterium]